MVNVCFMMVGGFLCMPQFVGGWGSTLIGSPLAAPRLMNATLTGPRGEVQGTTVRT